MTDRSSMSDSRNGRKTGARSFEMTLKLDNLLCLVEDSNVMKVQAKFAAHGKSADFSFQLNHLEKCEKCHKSRRLEVTTTTVLPLSEQL